MRTHHPQVRIAHGDNEAEVDEKLAPLILELWRADIMTWQSCQRHFATGKVWISFYTAADAESFLNIVVRRKQGRVPSWERAEGWYFGCVGHVSEPLDGPGHPKGWEFHASINDFSESPADKDGVALEPDFWIGVAVLFPRQDLRRVLERVRAYNGEEKES